MQQLVSISMASAHWRVDSDFRSSYRSYRCSRSGGHRPRTRRRGTYFPRHNKNVLENVAAPHCVGHGHYADDDTPSLTLRDFESTDPELMSSGDEEKTGCLRDHFSVKGDEVSLRGKHHKYGPRNTLSQYTGNSKDFFHSENLSTEFDFRSREEKARDDVSAGFDDRKHHRGRHTSGRAENHSFQYHENEMTKSNNYARRGRGGRGGRGRGRKCFVNLPWHSSTKKDSLQFDWREGMTSTDTGELVK